MLGIVRLARTGVNILMLDSDCVMLHDWYRVPSALPDVHMWTLQDHASPANVNTGTYYIRGAHRDGPVLWVLYQMVDWVCCNSKLCNARAIHSRVCWHLRSSAAHTCALQHTLQHGRHNGGCLHPCELQHARTTELFELTFCLLQSGTLQIARWHDDQDWLHTVRDQLNLPIEDFEQNLVGYALIAARAGAVPQMYIDSESSATAGLHFAQGRDLAALRRVGSSDESVLSVDLSQPQGFSAAEHWDQWSPPSVASVDIAGQLRSAKTLRQRWRHGKRGIVGPDSTVSQRAHAGVASHAKAYQLVVPEGQVSHFDDAQLQVLKAAQDASPAALQNSKAELRAQGLLFLAALPPVRSLFGAVLLAELMLASIQHTCSVCSVYMHAGIPLSQ